jgi:hypothetical protein
LLTRVGLAFEQAPVESTANAATPTGNSERSEALPAVELISDPDLRELQGRWDRHASAHAPSSSPDVIEFRQDHLIFKTRQPDGTLQAVLDAAFSVARVGPFKVARLSIPAAAPGASKSVFAAGDWLYKVVGEDITIAWNLDATAPGQPPVVQNYHRAVKVLATTVGPAG